MRSFGNQFGNSLYSKDKNNHTSNNQQYNNTQTSNSGYQQQPQQQSYPQNNQTNQSAQNQHNQQPYQHQQDFSQLTNLGLTVMQQGENLVVVGENVFDNKETIKQNGFRWDSNSKSWYMPLRQAA